MTERPTSRRGPSGVARVVDIVLRTAHIATIGVVVGGAWLGVPAEQFAAWWHGAAGTGVGLIVSEIAQGRHWPHQGRGLMLWAKLLLLAPALVWPAWLPAALLGAVAIGSIGSHMPRRFRHWSLVHRRVVD